MRKCRDTCIRFNGGPSLTLGIFVRFRRQCGGRGGKVDQRLAELEYQRPAGMQLATVYNQPNEVDKSVSAFMLNLGEAVAIVIAVLLVFMGLRSGVLMGGLLLTILGTFIVMKMLAIDLQRISLGALIIALGMLVDNAIVVTEGILVGMKRGLSKLQAASEIVRQTVWPLLGATVIAIMAFAPIGLSDDATGEYTNSLFWVLLISLLLSWITAITLVPFFAEQFFSDKDVGGADGEAEDPYKGRVFVLYRRLLDRAIHHRVLTLSGMGVLLVLAVLGFGFVKQAFFPPSNTPMFLVDYWLPQGSDIRATREASERLERSLLEMDSVTQVTTTIGQGAPVSCCLTRRKKVTPATPS